METIRAELAGAPVIIGGGLAGLMTALRMAPQPVILLAKTPLAQGAASAWAASLLIPPTRWTPSARGWRWRRGPARGIT